MEIKPIGQVNTCYGEKFGVPRQSGLAETAGSIRLFPPFDDPNAVRGLEGYSHLWIIWGFSLFREDGSFHPTVRPPRLGGNTRMGVFATRSPRRPNSLGLSLVKLLEVRTGEAGTELVISGADMVSGTPVYDIKPYLPGVEAIPEARGGFTDTADWQPLEVRLEGAARGVLTENEEAELKEILKEDPRPPYQEDPERVYGFVYRGKNVKFTVSEGILTVTEILG